MNLLYAVSVLQIRRRRGKAAGEGHQENQLFCGELRLPAFDRHQQTWCHGTPIFASRASDRVKGAADLRTTENRGTAPDDCPLLQWCPSTKKAEDNPPRLKRQCRVANPRHTTDQRDSASLDSDFWLVSPKLQSSSRTIFVERGASIPTRTAFGPILTTVTATSSPMRIRSPVLRESTSILFHHFLLFRTSLCRSKPTTAGIPQRFLGVPPSGTPADVSLIPTSER